jgi:nitrite reductase/ring-hydroxylating ferredoxin subunit
VTAWHALVRSDDVLVGAIVPVALQDDDLVIWRDVTGVVHAHEARCPHNWSHLAGVGEVQGCELVCTTHFWRFTPSGRGFQRLSDGTEEPMRDLPKYRCREHEGWVQVSR